MSGTQILFSLLSPHLSACCCCGRPTQHLIFNSSPDRRTASIGKLLGTATRNYDLRKHIRSARRPRVRSVLATARTAATSEKPADGGERRALSSLGATQAPARPPSGGRLSPRERPEPDGAGGGAAPLCAGCDPRLRWGGRSRHPPPSQPRLPTRYQAAFQSARFPNSATLKPT